MNLIQQEFFNSNDVSRDHWADLIKKKKQIMQKEESVIASKLTTL
jgi:hypothetical protein